MIRICETYIECSYSYIGIRKHEIGSGTKLLFTFLSLMVFRQEERETQSFYADYFYIVRSQPNQRS